jgi:hypothetical protein
MTQVIVDPGVCQMNATIGVTKVSRRQLKVEITTDCEMITKMGELLLELDLNDIMKSPVNSKIYQCASQCRVHPSCPIPMAIIKASEAEAGLALPRSVSVYFQP